MLISLENKRIFRTSTCFSFMCSKKYNLFWFTKLYILVYNLASIFFMKLSVEQPKTLLLPQKLNFCNIGCYSPLISTSKSYVIAKTFLSSKKLVALLCSLTYQQQILVPSGNFWFSNKLPTFQYSIKRYFQVICSIFKSNAGVLR